MTFSRPTTLLLAVLCTGAAASTTTPAPDTPAAVPAQPASATAATPDEVAQSMLVLARRMAERNGVIYRFLYNKWYFDELYDFVFVRGFRAIGNFFWKICDVKIIDGLGPNGAAWVSLKSAARLGKIQSGYVYHYAFVMLLGVAGLLTFAILAWGA